VINDPKKRHDIEAVFPFLRPDEGDFYHQFMGTASIVRLDKGEYICHEGRACGHLALVMAGSARVFKLGESGREITLYRVGPGQSCILTTSCILSNRPFPAFAICESEMEAAVIPATAVNSWLAESKRWRDYIFGLVAQRLDNIISVVEEVAFKRMDRRIAEYLCQRGPTAGNSIHITHQQIASDLGTSREVVSRILKDFESTNLIDVGRGTVTILDPTGLREKSRES